MNCIKCNKKATKIYRPDLDLTGIGMCDKHKDEVTLDILLANMEGWDKFEKKYFKKK